MSMSYELKFSPNNENERKVAIAALRAVQEVLKAHLEAQGKSALLSFTVSETLTSFRSRHFSTCDAHDPGLYSGPHENKFGQLSVYGGVHYDPPPES